LPDGNAEYVPVNVPENDASPPAWHHGNGGQVKGGKRRGVQIREINEDGTPKEDAAATDEQHFGHSTGVSSYDYKY